MQENERVAPADGPELSIIVPMYNEEGNVRPLAERVRQVAADEALTYELLYVDDGSTDGSVREVLALAEESPEVRLVTLARNFGKEAAMLAGYDHAQGQVIAVIDADLQQPPELFGEMLALWRQGYDVVDAVRADTLGISRIRKSFSTLFYWVNQQLAGIAIPSQTADFRLLDRAVVDAVRQCREYHRFNRALVAWIGFRHAAITYTAAPRHAGKTHWGHWKLIQYAMDGILSFSIRPLRLMGLLGGGTCALSILYMVFVAILRIVRPELAGANFGYASIIGMIALLGGFQFMGIWLLGEYTGRTYEQVKERPVYVLRQAGDRGRARGAAVTRESQTTIRFIDAA
ncbi:MAG: glycosyltransferase family 2 protein [Isosphaeraceae bacterium]|nr:glycosyltransferase family 2 protein [Isosphaeraceae bacterium]